MMENCCGQIREVDTKYAMSLFCMWNTVQDNACHVSIMFYPQDQTGCCSCGLRSSAVHNLLTNTLIEFTLLATERDFYSLG